MRRKPVRLLAAPAFAMLLTATAALAASDDWPRFRGPDGTGVIADDPALPERWSATENVAWSVPIPGLGWSSPIVWGDRAFVTTVVADEDYEGPQPGLYLPAGGADTPPDPPPGTHHWLLICLDVANGAVVWQRTAHSGPMTATIHPKNSFASATPVTDGERVYALFGNLGLFAYDLDGRLVWSRDIEALPDQWGWGAGSSPALLDDQVLVMHDNDEASYLASFDAATGERNWRTPRDEVSAWSTPFVWRNDVRTEIVTVARTRVRSYDPAGNLLWWFAGDMTSATVPTPVPGDGIIYVSSGHVGHDHRPVYAVLPGAEGDITLRPRQRSNEYIRWYDPRGASYNPSPLLYRGIYYTAARPRVPDRTRRPHRAHGLRPRPHRAGSHVHGVAVGLQRQDLRAQRGRRHLRHRGRARLRAAWQEHHRRDDPRIAGRSRRHAAAPHGVTPLRHPPLTRRGCPSHGPSAVSPDRPARVVRPGTPRPRRYHSGTSGIAIPVALYCKAVPSSRASRLNRNG